MTKKNSGLLETIIESALWKSRLVIILPVFFGIFAAFALFITASYEVFQTIIHLDLFDGSTSGHTGLVIHIITAIDQYLIGIVLLIFSFGIYELFISDIDIARKENQNSILDIGSLDELKNKILKVIIMVLIVSLSRAIMTVAPSSATEILLISLAILAMSGCVFLVRNIEGDK
jgi:uncharacterized protein (TIGR00645 family)